MTLILEYLLQVLFSLDQKLRQKIIIEDGVV